MNARVVASDPDEPTTTIQASHYSGAIQLASTKGTDGGYYSHDVVLGHKCSEGKPQARNKAPWTIDVIKENHTWAGGDNIPKNHTLYSRLENH